MLPINFLSSYNSWQTEQANERKNKRIRMKKKKEEEGKKKNSMDYLLSKGESFMQ